MGVRRMVGVVVLGLLALAATGWGVYILVVQQTGHRTEAEVGDCERQGRVFPFEHYRCVGTWTIGAGTAEERVVVGSIETTDPHADGEVINVRARGTSAYAAAPWQPLILLGLGVILAGQAWLTALRGRPPQR